MRWKIIRGHVVVYHCRMAVVTFSPVGISHCGALIAPALRIANPSGSDANAPRWRSPGQLTVEFETDVVCSTAPAGESGWMTALF